MNIKKIIRVFYIAYTVYIIIAISSTDMVFFEILPAIIIMWINYFAFCLGYSLNKRNYTELPIDKQKNNSLLLMRKKSFLLTIAVISIIFSILAVKYYTGQSPMSVFQNLTTDKSLYYEYQKYFQNQQRGVFSLNKIPFILMLFYVKFMLIYSFVTFFILKDKTTRFEKLYLMLITISFIYIGIARGTSFEFFELYILVTFIVFSRYKKKNRLPIKQLFKIISLSGIMIYIFYSGIIARGIVLNNQISRDIHYDPNAIMSILPPFFSFVTLVIFGYFGFGFFYVSKYVSDVWFSSLEFIIAGFLPLGIRAVGMRNVTDYMREMIDMGAMWHPDVALLINNFGFLGLFFICFFIGALSQYIYKETYNGGNVLIFVSGYVVLLQMLSLPIGNFISTSSANQLIVLLLGTIWFWKLMRISRIKI